MRSSAIGPGSLLGGADRSGSKLAGDEKEQPKPDHHEAQRGGARSGRHETRSDGHNAVKGNGKAKEFEGTSFALKCVLAHKKLIHTLLTRRYRRGSRVAILVF